MSNGRRRFLASAAAAAAGAFAGCAGGDGADDREPFGVDEPLAAAVREESDGIDSPATSLVDDVHVVDLQTAELTYALAPTGFRSTDRPRSSNRVEVRLAFGRTATDDHPATVRARITNASNWERTVDLEETPPFVPDVADAASRIDRRPDDGNGAAGVVDREPARAGELSLAPTDDASHVSVPDGSPTYERGPRGHWRLADGVEWELPDSVDLDARESIQLAFALVGPPGSEGRRPGTYAVGGGDRITAVAWPTGEPGTAPDGRFAGVDLPPLPDAWNETGWYHEADRSTGTYVEPDVERARAPAELAFDLVNRSRELLSASGWRLFKLDGGEWYPVAPRGPFGGEAIVTRSASLPFLSPGRIRRWRLRAFGGEAPSDGGGYVDVPHLGGGRYAFAVRGVGEEVAAAAFDLEGPPLALEPTDGLSRSRDGETVRLVSPERDEGEEPWALALEPTDDDGDADGLLVETLYRDSLRGLRNVLAVAVETDARRVVLETSRSVAIGSAGGGVFLDAAPGRRVRFRGRTYELEAEPLEGD